MKSARYIFHTSNPLELERPLGLMPLQAGFPAPTENYIEAMIDLNRELIKNPLTTFYAHVGTRIVHIKLCAKRGCKKICVNGNNKHFY